MLRRWVAALGHAPALWLLYREKLPRPLVRQNVIAAIATLVVIMLAASLAPPGRRFAAAVAAWLCGHFAWGILLFVRLPDRPGR